jgi:hypothetical protein
MKDRTEVLAERLEELRLAVEAAERDHDVAGVADGVEQAERVAAELERRRDSMTS